MARARTSNLEETPGFDEAVTLDTLTEKTGKSSTKSKMYKATLISGRVYYYENMRFEGGKEQLVSEEVKNYLEENAFLIGENKIGNQVKQFKQPRFSFTKA